MSASPRHSERPGLTDTAFRVVEAGQRVMRHRLELARLDLAGLIPLGVRTAMAVVAGTVLLSGAWYAIMAAFAVLLHHELALSLPSSLVIVAAVTALAGLVTLGVCLRRVASLERAALGAEVQR